METKFSKSSVKFLNKLAPKKKKQIRVKLLLLLNSLENQRVIPFQELDVKRLKGNWQGLFRMRVGKIRIIFTIDEDRDEILVYDIDFRGDVYK